MVHVVDVAVAQLVGDARVKQKTDTSDPEGGELPKRSLYALIAKYGPGRIEHRQGRWNEGRERKSLILVAPQSSCEWFRIL